MTDLPLARAGPSRSWSAVTLLILLVLSGVASAADVEVIGQDGDIHLDKLQPLSPQLTAILAYHAMVAGTGCPILVDKREADVDDGHLHCQLTDALGLGYQCSPTHTGVVKQWFGRNLDALFGHPASKTHAIKDDDLTWHCESTGDESSAHSEWISLRVRTKSNRVTVDGEISSRNRNDEVGMYEITSKIHVIYEIHPDWVEVISRSN
jgi:hypothetical protein